MRVWIENPFDNLPVEGFRPQRYWLMADAFARAGHEVVLWTSAFSHMRKVEREVEKLGGGGCRDGGAGFDYVLVPAPAYRTNVSFARIRNHRVYARNWEKLARERAGAEGKPDLLIVSTPPLSTADVAIRLKRDFGCRLVVDIMDDWPGTFYRLLPRPFRFLGRILFAPLQCAANRLYAAADCVTGVAARYGELVAPKSYRTFYHGIEMCAGGRVACDGELRLVYAGNLGRTYDLKTVILAVAALPEATLDVAGEGEQLPALKALAAELAPTRIRFHGYLAEAALTQLLSTATIGVIPMSSESCVGVPYKMADYARAGLAIVSALSGESAALLQRFGAGESYQKSDATSLREALQRLKPRLEVASEASRRLAEQVFDATTIYREYVDFLCAFSL